MTRTIEAIQIYPKMHGYSKIQCSFQIRSKMTQQTRESGDEALALVYGTVSGKISV